MAPSTATLTIAACAALVCSSNAFMLPAAKVSMSAQKPQQKVSSAKSAAAIFAAGAVLSGSAFTAPVNAAGLDSVPQQVVGSVFNKAANKVTDVAVNKVTDALQSNDGAATSSATRVQRAQRDDGTVQQGSKVLDDAKVAGNSLKDTISAGNALKDTLIADKTVGNAVDAVKGAGAKAQDAIGNFGSSNTISANNIAEDVKQGIKSATSAVSSKADAASNSAAVPNTWSQSGSVNGAVGQAKSFASNLGSSNSGSGGGDKGALPNGGGSPALDQAKVAGQAFSDTVGGATDGRNVLSDAKGAAQQAKQAVKSSLGSSNVISANIVDDVKQGIKSGSVDGAVGKAKSIASNLGSSNSNSGGGDKGALPNGGGSPALDQAKVAGQAFSDTVGGATDGQNVLSDAKGAAQQAKQAVKSSLGSSNVISLNFGKPQDNKNAGDLNPRNAPTILDGVKQASEGAQRNADKAQDIVTSNADKVSNAGGDLGDAVSQAGSTLKSKAQQAGDAMETKGPLGEDKKANFGSSNVVSFNFGKPQPAKNAAVGDVNPTNAPTLADGLKQANEGTKRNLGKIEEVVKDNAKNVPGAGEDLTDAVSRASKSVEGEAKQGLNNLGTSKGW